MTALDQLHPLVIAGALWLLFVALWVWSSLRGDGPPPSSRRWVLYRHHLGDYMHRWILRTPFGNLRLHHILRSDADRHLHDHPFDFTSFLLTGGYVEYEFAHPDRLAPGVEVFQKRNVWRRWSIVRKRAEDLHRLELARPVWTLVLSGPKRRAWGFWTEAGWVNHRDYLHMFPEVVRERVGEQGAEDARRIDAERRARGEAP